MTESAQAPSTEASSKPRPAARVDLLTQILVVSNCVERLEISEEEARRRGLALGEAWAHELRSLRQTVRTLELLMQHEAAFVQVVKQARGRSAR